MSIESLGHLGIRQEKKFGEEADNAVEAFEEVLEEAMKTESHFVSPQYAVRPRYCTRAMPGRISAGGEIITNVRPTGALPWILKGLLGNISSTEITQGVFEHIFSPVIVSPLPSFDLRIEHADSSLMWLGCSFATGSLFIERDKLMELRLEVLSQRPHAVESNPPPVFSRIPHLSGRAVEFTLNGEKNTNFESFSLVFNNNLAPAYRMDKKRWCYSHHAGQFDVSGSITMLFETDEQRRRMWGSVTAVTPENIVAPCSISLGVEHGYEIIPEYKYSLLMDFPQIHISSAPANIKREKDRILQTLNFFPVYCKEKEKVLDIRIRNEETGYPNPVQNV